MSFAVWVRLLAVVEAEEVAEVVDAAVEVRADFISFFQVAQAALTPCFAVLSRLWRLNEIQIEEKSYH